MPHHRDDEKTRIETRAAAVTEPAPELTLEQKVDEAREDIAELICVVKEQGQQLDLLLHAMRATLDVQKANRATEALIERIDRMLDARAADTERRLYIARASG